MGWLSGWNRRKSHLINAAAGAGTQYQVCIKVYKGSGVDGTETLGGTIAGKIYCGGNCRDDFGDVRFTSSDGTTLLDYWIEPDTLVSGTSAIFWVEVSEDLSSVNRTIYVYYDKSDATSISNGGNTFVYFDDFASGNMNNYTLMLGSAGDWEIVSYNAGYATKNCLHKKVATDSFWKLNGSSIQNFRSKHRIKQPLPTTNGYFGIAVRIVDPTHCYAFWGQREGATPKGAWWKKNVTYSLIQAVYATEVLDVFTVMEVILNGSSGKSWRNNIVEVNSTDTTFANAGSIGPFSWYESYMDYWWVAKYVSPEPAHSTWGSEEAFGVTTSAASGITSSTAILNGSVVSGDNFYARGFDWGLSSGVYTGEWYETGSFGQGSFNHAISGLAQGTLIYFRAKAMQTEGGNWVYGAELSFRTLIILSITSSPFTPINLTVDGVAKTTPYSAEYAKDANVTLVITQTEPVTNGGIRYEFQKWEDDTTNKTRVVTITGTSTITTIAYYRKLYKLTIASSPTAVTFELGMS